MRGLLLTLGWLLALALTALVGVRATGIERGTIIVLLIGALPLTLLPAYALLVAAVLRRRRALGALSALLVGAHLIVLAPALGASERPAGFEAAPRLRVVTANLYVLNPDPQAAGRALRTLRPDVLVVPELNAAGLAGLRASGLLVDLPFSVVQLADRAETVGLFSRLPLDDVTLRSVGGRALPRATITVGSTRLRLLAEHPLPPISALEVLWRRSLGDLARESQALTMPAVVAGDLNAGRDHALFRQLLDTGLRDAHDDRGRGTARTWPAALPLLLLDHVLVKDGPGGRIVVLSVREVELPGSDHLGVVADLAVLAG